MTNREKIAEMKVVDYFKKYYVDIDAGNTFTEMIERTVNCNKCPIMKKAECIGSCYDDFDKWLDKEVSE